uniref:Uncharacterized protein n=1 Tax=Rhizophagus irregularis (strain DAOM 181602 / DAOM 197198 / MUCL 43194) TaxID=747089 RepID=U9SXP8_RHIID
MTILDLTDIHKSATMHRRKSTRNTKNRHFIGSSYNIGNHMRKNSRNSRQEEYSNMKQP